MCQENNSAEAKLQKLTKLQIYFLRDFSTRCPSARTPEPVGIHAALQQVTAPNPRHGAVTPRFPHTQRSPGRAGCYEHGSLPPGAPISAAPGTASLRSDTAPTFPPVPMPITARLSPVAAQLSPFSGRPSAAGSAAPGRAG